MLFEHSSYRSFLKSVLASRIAANPRYSLRAMAKQLGILPSHLSAIHSGTKNLSETSALKVAQRLGLAGREADYFCLLVQYESSSDPELKDNYLRRLRAINGACDAK